MKRVLVVSIAFPPKNDPECLQVAKYIKYLRQCDLALDIVTSSMPTLFMPHDESLEQYDYYSNGNKVEIRIWETKIGNFLLRKLIPGGINYPDSKFSFHLQCSKAIEKIREKPDVIYSRSNPLSSALMACKIKEYFNVPWVMHLSDPWIGSPMVRYSRREYRFNKKWQDQCFERADRICFTTQKALEFYQATYPLLAEKFFISPNVYDPEDVKNVSLDFNGRLRMVYAGGLAGDRSAEFFLKACAKAWKINPGLAESEIIFAGAIDRKNRLLFEKCDLPFVKHIGEISYSDALQLQETAHILLAIDQAVEEPEKAMFFPSKILDYFLIKRKILAITNAGSSTASILAPLNSAVVYYDQPVALHNFLLCALDAFRRKNASFFISEELPENFSAEENSLKLAALLKTL